MQQVGDQIVGDGLFRPYWSRLFKFNWQTGLFFILLLGIPRFYLVLKANQYEGYGLVAVIFILMMILPWILLLKGGRQRMGMTKPNRYINSLTFFVMGVVCGWAVYLLGNLLFGSDLSNWYVYIARSYVLPEDWVSQRNIYFIIFALIAMTFSPIGEELFYRGLVHECFVDRFGQTGASRIDSMAFALTHLAHFGIVYTIGGWEFLTVPAMIWVGLMYLVSRMFFGCRRSGNSILGSIICHAGFNLAMTYCIFYWVL